MTVRQHSFYLEDDDWVALRHLCLDRGVSVSSFIAQAARDAIAGPQTKATAAFRVGGTITDSHMDGDTRVIDKVELHEVSLVADTKANRDAGAGHVITTPAEAAAVAPYNPVRAVPKPAPRKSSKAKVRA